MKPVAKNHPFPVSYPTSGSIYLLFLLGQGATITEEPSSPVAQRGESGSELGSDLVVNLLMKISSSLEELKENSKSNFSLIESQLIKQNTILTQRNEILEQQRYIEQQRFEIEKQRFQLETAKAMKTEQDQGQGQSQPEQMSS